MNNSTSGPVIPDRVIVHDPTMVLHCLCSVPHTHMKELSGTYQEEQWFKLSQICCHASLFTENVPELCQELKIHVTEHPAGDNVHAAFVDRDVCFGY